MLRRNAEGYAVGDGADDLRAELVRYAQASYVPTRFADCVCAECGAREFLLLIDENEGAAVRVCGTCGADWAIGDSGEFLDGAELEERECVCELPLFEITVGVALYEGSDDVRWLYVGCRCPACGVLGCYGDWKNEFNGVDALLARV
jgi:hypothetical protein